MAKKPAPEAEVGPLVVQALAHAECLGQEPTAGLEADSGHVPSPVSAPNSRTCTCKGSADFHACSSRRADASAVARGGVHGREAAPVFGVPQTTPAAAYRERGRSLICRRSQTSRTRSGPVYDQLWSPTGGKRMGNASASPLIS